MPDLQYLQTSAEIFVALAGFAGIVATFQFRKNATPNAAQIMSLTIIVKAKTGHPHVESKRANTGKAAFEKAATVLKKTSAYFTSSISPGRQVLAKNGSSGLYRRK